MTEENISQEFRLKNVDETRSYLIVEINGNKLINKKHKKICTTLSCIEHFLVSYYFSFYNSWIRFHFCFCFFDWYSYRNYNFSNWIKNLRNNCRN